MSNVFQQIISIPVPFNMIVMIVLIGCTAGVVTTIASEVRKYFTHREAIDFKRELADRGMTADEIERIIKAKQK